MLPSDLMKKIIDSMENKDLFDVIRSNAPVNRAYTHYARIALFERLDRNAATYQHTLLACWLRHWSIYQKLSFIPNDEEKTLWLNLLNKHIQNPYQRWDFKIVCCLLLNKLFPKSAELTPLIIEKIVSSTDGNKIDAFKFDAFGTALSASDNEKIINKLNMQLTSRYADKRRDAIEHLSKLSSHVNLAQRQNIVKKLADQLMDEKSLVRDASIEALEKLVSDLDWGMYLDKTTVDRLIASLVQVMNGHKKNLNANIIGILKLLLPYASPTGQAMMIAPLFARLNVYQSAEILGELASLLTHHRTPIIECFKNALNHKNVDTRKSALSGLGKFAQCISEGEVRNHIVDVIVAQLKKAHIKVRLTAFTLLEKLAKHTKNSEERKKIIALLLAELNHTNEWIRQASISTLRDLVPSGNDEECIKIMACIIKKNNDPSENVRENTVRLLGKLALKCHDEAYKTIMMLLREKKRKL